MNFQPLNVQFYGSGCKILNYYNLKHSPAYVFPKDTKDSWLPKNQYSPPSNPPKTKSNYKYTELYNTREQYIHGSQKITAPSYSFGKAGLGEDEFYTKTRKNKTQNKSRAKSAKYKNIKFGEEDLGGDNCANPNMGENNSNKKNKNKENDEEPYHQYYEIGKQFVNESTQNKAPLYSFAGGAFGQKYLTHRRLENNFSPQNDFYELRKAYVKESKKPRILGYHFGTQKRLDANIKKKWVYKGYGINKKDGKKEKKNDKNDFKEEKNFQQADNLENNNNDNINDNNDINREDKKEKKISPKNNKSEEIKFNNSKEMPHDYYNLREHYIYESQKPRILGYSFGKMSRTKKDKIGEETFFYNLNEKYVNESQKPKAPNYSFGRPKTVFYDSKNKNKNKIKIRPKSAVNISEEEKNTPGPGRYNVAKEFGNDGIKIGISKFGRKYGKGNGVPGPGRYRPDINFVKRQYPIYSIGKAEREGCSYPMNYNYKNRMNVSYGSQYYRKNPSWIYAKTCKGEELHNKVLKENYRYY